MEFEHKDELLRCAYAGDLVLFLGAGAVAGSSVGREKTPAYLGQQLAERLAKEFFPTEPYKNESLKRITTDIENIETKEKLVRVLSDLLMPVLPTSALKIMPKIPWHAIYTVNVDNSLETAYSEVDKKVQVLVPVVKPDDRLAIMTLSEVSYFKLHGCLSVDPSNVIFSHKDYTEVREKYLKLFSNLNSHLCDKPFLFVGFGFEDNDFQEVWESIKKYTGFRFRHQKTFVLWPDPPERFVKSMKIEGVTVINSVAQDFMPWLAVNLAGRPTTVREKVAERTNLMRLLFEKEFSANIPPELLDKLKSFAEVVSHIPSPTKVVDNSRFYLGESPDWDDIKLGLPIKRTLSEDILLDLEHWLTSGSVKSSLILGPAGYGKTTMLMSISDKVVNSYNLFSIWIKDTNDIDSAVLSEVISIVGKPVVVVVDDGYRCIHALRKLLQDCRDNKLKLFLLVSSRPADWNSAKQTSSLEKINTINLERLNPDEAYCLAEAMQKSGKLSRDFSTKSLEELKDHYVVEGERHIIAGLMTSVYGDGVRFEEIIANEFFKIPLDLSKEAYLIIALVHSFGANLPLFLFLKCLDLDVDQYKGVFSSIEGTIIEENDAVTGELVLKTQHRVIAECLLENVLSPSRANEILFLVGKNLNTHSAAEAGILIKLYNENYLENILKEPSYIRSFYQNLSLEFPSDAFILQHWAIYESKNDNFEKAKSLIDDAITIIDSDSKIYFHFVNTKGVIWLREAISEEDNLRAEYLLRKGSDFIRDLIKVDADKEMHYISLIDKLFSYAQRQQKRNEDRVVIYEVIENDLEEALRRYPNSSELLTQSGKLEVELSHLPGAEQLLKRSLELNRGNQRARILLIRLNIINGQYSPALDLVEDGLVLDPKSYALLKFRIVCFRRLNSPWHVLKPAIKEYLKAVAKDMQERLSYIQGLIDADELKEASEQVSILKKLDVSFIERKRSKYRLKKFVVEGSYRATHLGKGYVEIDGFPKGFGAFINLSDVSVKGKIHEGLRLKCVIGLNGYGLYVIKII